MWAGRGFLRLRKYTVAASFYPHVHVVDVGTPARRLDEVRLEMSFGERERERERRRRSGRGGGRSIIFQPVQFRLFPVTSKSRRELRRSVGRIGIRWQRRPEPNFPPAPAFPA